MPETTDERDFTSHPAWGMATVNRVSCGPPGMPLFDSELQHHEVVMLRIAPAQRKRELARDWIMAENSTYIEIRMSMAQWGALVSSFGTSGVPVTVAYLDGERVEEIEYAPRMVESLKEVDEAGDRLLAEIKEARDAVEEAFANKAGRRELGDLLRTLHYRIENGTPNLNYVAKSLSEHVEHTVTKARADIEAMAVNAAQRGLEAGSMPTLMLPGAEEGTTS